MSTIVKIYSDPNFGLITADGFAQRTGVSEGWAVIRNGAGTSAFSDIDTMNVSLSSGVFRKWTGIARAIMTFDLLSIPLGSVIQSARFCGIGKRKTDSFGYKPQIAIYQSYPLADNDIVAADYQQLDNTPLSNIINYDDFVIEDLNYFNLNAQGLVLLVPQQVCRLGLRETKFDAPFFEPEWQLNKSMVFLIYTVEYEVAAHRPYLEVTYDPPPPPPARKGQPSVRTLTPVRTFLPFRSNVAVRNVDP